MNIGEICFLVRRNQSIHCSAIIQSTVLVGAGGLRGLQCGAWMPAMSDVSRMRAFMVAGSVEIVPDLNADARWQLIERILLTDPFMKSTRLPGLLTYLAERSIRGDASALTEQRIGIVVFNKPEDYSPVEDSAVRVHVRQLRLRLHEYFNSEGRNETLTVDVPKGSYVLAFHNTVREPVPSPVHPGEVSTAALNGRRTRIWQVAAGLALVAALLCGLGWYRTGVLLLSTRQVPWPLNAVVQDDKETNVVIADKNTVLRRLQNRQFTLEDYLHRDYLRSEASSQVSANEALLINDIAESQLTSFADVVVTSTLVKLAGYHSDRMVMRWARDLNLRDLEHGNYIFVGSSITNPWVSLFESRLNFVVVEDGVGGKMYFRNKKPQPGEQEIYQGLGRTGSGGEDFATISLLPSYNGSGNVLIIEGLRQEGTEAVGRLLADAGERAKLEQAIGAHGQMWRPIYFETLIRTRSLAGAPVSIDVVSTRIINP